MSGRFYDPILQGWIDEIAAKTLWAALFFSSPLVVSDPATVEVIGAGYARVSMDQTRLAFNTLCNTTQLIWHNLAPDTHIAWIGTFDNDTAGVMQAAAGLAVPVDLLSGGTWALDAEQFVYGLDVSSGP